MTYRTAADYNSPQYRKWRLAVFKRDKFRCIICHSTKHIQAHHLKLWAHYPELRFDPKNGVTVCKIHHTQITGNEEAYENMLRNLINKSNKHDINRMLEDM